MNKKITVVIPCYNQGVYLMDALKSLEACDETLYDLIIVNDGSTDEKTISILKELDYKGFNVIFQENKGLGEARNVGIRLSKTNYILPLDADNILLPGYLVKAIEVLDSSPEVAVIYGNANIFGDRIGILRPGAFNLQQLMLCNYIDACAVIRKSSLEAVGMYDNMKIMGYEDWDLWLRLAFAGYNFYYIDETLFEYRVRKDSMLNSLNKNIKRQNEIEDYISNKYSDKLDFEFVLNRFVYLFKKKPSRVLYYMIVRKFFPKFFQRLIKENKMYKNFIYA